MADILTHAEIVRRHVDEWVLVGDPKTDDHFQVESGRVLFHSPDRDTVYRKAVELRPGRFAVVYTGQPSPDVAVVL